MGFSLPLMFALGSTRDRWPDDAVVVLGAGVRADGTPRLALLDRTRTGAALVRAGSAPILTGSGGPGPAGTHECDAMAQIAADVGLAPEQIVLDRGGLGTGASARAVAALLDLRGGRRVLVVSHAYHLPRARLAFERVGLDVHCSAARETRTLRALAALRRPRGGGVLGVRVGYALAGFA